MSKKTGIIIGLVLVTTAVLAYIVSTLLLKEKPTLPSKATGLSCPLNSGTCSWESDDSATEFKVKIVDKTTGSTIIEKTTTDKTVQFTPQGNHNYDCIVTPVNSCGMGTEAKGTNTCLLISGTPPPTSTPSITPEISVTPETSITPNETETPSPTEEVTPSVTPTGELSETPTPSETPNPEESTTPSVTPSRTPTGQPSATPTSVPGISPTPTEIILVRSTSTPNPTQELVQNQSSENLPPSGTITGWIILAIPLALVALAFIF